MQGRKDGKLEVSYCIGILHVSKALTPQMALKLFIFLNTIPCLTPPHPVNAVVFHVTPKTIQAPKLSPNHSSQKGNLRDQPAHGHLTMRPTHHIRVSNSLDLGTDLTPIFYSSAVLSCCGKIDRDCGSEGGRLRSVVHEIVRRVQRTGSRWGSLCVQEDVGLARCRL
jgi:hypothetical protein